MGPERQQCGESGDGDPQRLVEESSKSVQRTLSRVRDRKRQREEKRIAAQRELEGADAGDDDEELEWEEDVEDAQDAVVEAEGIDDGFYGVALEKPEEEVDEADTATVGVSNEKAEDEIVLEIEQPAGTGSTEDAPKAKRLRTSPEERQFYVDVHTAHLTALVASMPRRMDRAADDPELQAAAAELLPAQPIEALASLRRAVVSFAATMRTAALGYGGDGHPDLVVRCWKAVRDRVGRRLEVATVLAAALRARGLRARATASLMPLSHRPRTDGLPPTDAMRTWSEVYCGHRWVPACPTTGAVDNVRVLLGERTKGAASGRSRGPRRRRGGKQPGGGQESPKKATTCHAHVVACERGKLRCVTRRYTPEWHRVTERRAPGDVLKRTLEALSALRAPLANAGAVDSASEAEAEEMERLAMQEPLPTVQSAYQNHARYVLEKFLNRFEVLHPRRPVLGYIAGLPVYPRRCVQTLRSRERWIREMREVRDDAEPVRHVAARKGSSKDGEQIELFGHWQTDPYEVPAAVDGIVPKDEHGRIEVWTPAHVPRGCVHVRLKYAAQMARRLQIDYALAMVGFEVKQGGKSVPKFEGAVVCEENRELLEDAAMAGLGAKIEADAKKEFDELVKLWRKVIRAVRAKDKVRRKYGGMIEHDVSYLKAKRMGIDLELKKPGVAAPDPAAQVRDDSAPAPNPDDQSQLVESVVPAVRSTASLSSDECPE